MDSEIIKESERIKTARNEGVGFSDLLCGWHLEDDDNLLYRTDCDHHFMLTCGELDDHEIKFCCYCGKEIEFFQLSAA